MSRLSWSISVILALLVSAYASELLVKGFSSAPVASFVATTSSSVATVVPNSFPSWVFPELPSITQPSTNISASTTSSKEVLPPTPVKSKTTAPAIHNAPEQTPPPTQPGAPVAEPVVVPPLPVSGSDDLDATAARLRNALVNIVCYAPAGSGLHSILGSGIMVDQKGIILTNAHVAQYFLLRNLGVSCVVRVGSPAQDAYTARLIYISPEWITANADVLTQASPTGNGENDFALLGVIESATDQPLPVSFPAISLATLPPEQNTPVVIASFGAQFLDITQIQSALFPTVVFGSVKKVFTFATDTIDAVDLGGSAAAQEGSSGGGIATAAGTLAGTITTSTIEGTTDTRSLSAITASYIRAEYAHETNNTLDTLLAEPLSVSISDFAPKIPALEATITAALH